MPYPTPIVEIAFDASPYDVSPTWTNVTSWVRSLSTDRGRSDDWDDFYGSAQVVLNNRTRLFDPYNTSGTYYGKLLPRKQIRITANADPGRTNLVPNPSFETNTTGWVAASLSLLRVTTDSFVGSASMQMTSTSNVALDARTAYDPNTLVIAGQVYTASAYLKNTAGNNRSHSIQIRWFNSGGALISTSSTTIAINVGSPWTRVSVTGSAPVGAVNADVAILTQATNPSTTNVALVDGVMLEQSSTAGTYFDGSTVGYAWNGTPNASTSSSVYQPVFRGYISGWNPSWTDAGTDSTVTLSCFDALQLLGSEQLPADWSKQYIISTSPRHYYPCDDPITPFTAGGVLTDYGSAPQNMITTALASSGSQLAVGLVNSSLQGTDGTAAATATGAVQPATAFTVSMWTILNPGAAYVYGEASDCFWIIGFNGTTSKYFVEVVSASAGLSFVYTTNQTYDTTARMVTFSFQALSSFQLYLDGVPVATTGTISAAIYVPFGEQTTIGNAQVQQVIIWNNIQTAATIQEIYKYSTVALPETTTARANRIIAETPFPGALCSFPASPAVSVLDITDDAPFVAPELRRVAASECAPLFVSKDGVITMYQQQQQFTQNRSIVSQITYGTGGEKMGQIFQLMPDGDSMRNEVNVSMSQGGVYTQRNQASVTAYGVSSQSVNSQVQTLADAQEIANITTSWGGNIYPRLSPVDVVLSSTQNWAPTLALELMDRITINAQPPSGGNAITVPMLVQNIKCEASPGFWKTTLEGSARWAAVFIIGQSLIGGTDLLG
jgi:hypothetical protein